MIRSILIRGCFLLAGLAAMAGGALAYGKDDASNLPCACMVAALLCLLIAAWPRRHRRFAVGAE